MTTENTETENPTQETTPSPNTPADISSPQPQPAPETTPPIPPEPIPEPAITPPQASEEKPAEKPTLIPPNQSTTSPATAQSGAPPLAGAEVPSLPPNPKSFLSKALDAIRFRKKAKLEKIVKLAQTKGSITNDDVEKLVRVSDATATRYLSELVRQNKLKRIGITTTTRYEPI